MTDGIGVLLCTLNSFIFADMQDCRTCIFVIGREGHFMLKCHFLDWLFNALLVYIFFFNKNVGACNVNVALFVNDYLYFQHIRRVRSI